MPAKKQTTKKSVGATEGILIGAGVAAAAAAGYFLFGPKGKQNRKKISAWTIKAKGEVLEKIEGLESLAEDKYHAIVDQVTAKYMKSADIANEDVEKFTKELKKYWKHIETDLAPKKKKAPAKKKPATKKK